jgi:hypothetical protein
MYDYSVQAVQKISSFVFPRYIYAQFGSSDEWDFPSVERWQIVPNGHERFKLRSDLDGENGDAENIAT